MRHIKKINVPTYFSKISTNLINNNRKWKYFGNKHRVCKLRLKNYILLNEQKNLCAYCEAEIRNKKDAHLEHIQPQSTAILRFDYNNIIVSCEGKRCSFNSLDESGHENESCGHKKSNKHDSSKFLDPTKIANINDYFEYNNDGKIKSSGIDDEKSIYTIEILNLDNTRLNGARKNAQLAIYKFLSSFQGSKKDKLINILSTPRAYISFLKYYYKNIIS